MRIGEYFRHNKSERNGAIALLVIGVLSLVGTEVYYRLRPPRTNSAELYARLDSLREASKPTIEIEPERIGEYFTFDPNTLPDSGFQKLGFSDREITSMRKYQKAGGTFRVKTDFGRLFFIDSLEYLALEPYIDLPEKKAKADTWKSFEKRDVETKEGKVKWSDTANYSGFSPSKRKLVELNSADTIQLVAVYGIGAYTAKSIVKRREELGGFYSLAQLMEIAKMTPERIDQIAPAVEIDRRKIRPISINSATARELDRHPYFHMNLANAVVMERERNGQFIDIQDFCKRNLVEPQLCAKFAPYLAFH